MGANIFSKFDVITAFNNLRTRKGEEWLIAFATRFGLWEYLVMLFGMCNAPAVPNQFHLRIRLLFRTH